MVKRREPVGQLGGEALDFRLEKPIARFSRVGGNADEYDQQRNTRDAHNPASTFSRK